MKSALAKGYALAAIVLAPVLTAHAATSAPGPGPGEETTRVVVQYKDLDLSQNKDAKRLYGRIVHAARLACDNDPESDLHRLAMYKMCMHEAVTNAVAQVNSSQLTTIYQADVRRRIPSIGG
jgi:UrcA family protein